MRRFYEAWKGIEVKSVVRTAENTFFNNITEGRFFCYTVSSVSRITHLDLAIAARSKCF